MSGHFERRLTAIAQAPRYDDSHNYTGFQNGLSRADAAWSEAASDPGWGGNAVAVAVTSFTARASVVRNVEDALSQMSKVISELNGVLDEAYNLLDALPDTGSAESALTSTISMAVAAGPLHIAASQKRITQAVEELEAAQAARELAAQAGYRTVTASINHSQTQIVQVMASAGIQSAGSSSGAKDGEYDVFDDLDDASKMSYDKLVEWTKSDDFQNMLHAARNNPSLLNDLLKNAMGAREWDLGSILAGIFNGLFGGYMAVPSFWAGIKMNENFGSGKVWDTKIYLAEEYGRDDKDGAFMLRDESGRMVRSDVFGNVNYGMMMAHLGVDQETALKAANLGTPNTGKGGDILDDRAVKFGYEMYRKYPNGMTEHQYREEIANAGLDDH